MGEREEAGVETSASKAEGDLVGDCADTGSRAPFHAGTNRSTIPSASCQAVIMCSGMSEGSGLWHLQNDHKPDGLLSLAAVEELITADRNTLIEDTESRAQHRNALTVQYCLIP